MGYQIIVYLSQVSHIKLNFTDLNRRNFGYSVNHLYNTILRVENNFSVVLTIATFDQKRTFELAVSLHPHIPRQLQNLDGISK